MRIPNVNKYRLQSSEAVDSTEIEVDIRPEEYIDDVGLFEDPKEYVKYMRRLESYIRKSIEYTALIDFLKNKKGMNKCGVHPNVSKWNGFRIELHHVPFTLYDYCSVVIAKRMKLNESLKMSAIAKEVMELHYLGLVGLYPVCETCHATCHSDDNPLFIPNSCVYGDPDKFYELYSEYMTDVMKTKYKNIQILNQGYNLIQQEIPVELQKHYIYVKQTDDSSYISTDKLIEFINDLN